MRHLYKLLYCPYKSLNPVLQQNLNQVSNDSVQAYNIMSVCWLVDWLIGQSVFVNYDEVTQSNFF